MSASFITWVGSLKLTESADLSAEPELPSYFSVHPPPLGGVGWGGIVSAASESQRASKDAFVMQLQSQEGKKGDRELRPSQQSD